MTGSAGQATLPPPTPRLEPTRNHGRGGKVLRPHARTAPAQAGPLSRDQRGILMELLYRHGGLTQQAIGAHLGGLDYTAVSHERRRVRERMAQSEVMTNWWRELDSALDAVQPALTRGPA